MAHKITESDYVVTADYRQNGQSARTWHSLEQPVIDPPTVVVQLSHYDENVAESRPLFLGDSTTEAIIRALYDGRLGTAAALLADHPITLIDDHQAICRAKDGKLHQIATGRYSIAQFRQLADMADSFLQSGNYKLATVGTLDAGARMFCSLYQDSQAIGNDNDRSEFFRNLISSHDSSTAFKVADSGIRIVCNNTLTFFDESTENTGFSMRHQGDLVTKLEDMTDMISKLDDMKMSNIEKWQAMSQVRWNAEEIETFLSFYYDEFYAVSTDDMKGASEAKKARTEELRLERKIKNLETMRQRIADEAIRLGVVSSAWLAANACNHWEANKTQRTKDRSTAERMVAAIDGGDVSKNVYAFSSAYDMVMGS